MRWPFKILGGFILFCLLSMVIHSFSKPSVMATVASSYDEEFEARAAAERAVSSTLQSPSTVKFIDQHSAKNSEGNWEVMGALDALNAYGVPMRSQYLCTFRREGDAMRLVKFTFPL